MSPESKLLSIQYANVTKSISKLEKYINIGGLSTKENSKYLLPVKQFLDFICHISVAAPIQENHLLRYYQELDTAMCDHRIKKEGDFHYDSLLLTVTLLKVDIFKATSQLQKKFDAMANPQDVIQETKQLQSVPPTTSSPNLFPRR